MGRYPPLPALYPDPPLPCHPPSYWLRLFLNQTFSCINTPTFLKPSHSASTCLWRWNRRSVPKQWHIKFRRWWITQKKAYYIQNTAKVWNQEYFTPMGRKLQDTFDYSKSSASRKPNSSFPLLSSFAAEITTPRFLQFHHHIHSRGANSIYQCTSFALLRERIHHNRWELDNTTRELLEIHLRLATVLSKSDWSLIDQLMFKKATCGGRQQGQTTPEIRTAPQDTTSSYKNLKKEMVINLSGQTLDDGSILVTTERS